MLPIETLASIGGIETVEKSDIMVANELVGYVDCYQ